MAPPPAHVYLVVVLMDNDKTVATQAFFFCPRAVRLLLRHHTQHCVVVWCNTT